MSWTKEETANVLAEMLALCSVWEKVLSEQQLAIYLRVLQDLPAADATKGISLAIRTCKFFPKPAELYELAAGNLLGNAQEAWMVLVEAMNYHGNGQSVIFTDAKLSHALEFIGGWDRVPQLEGKDLRIAQQDFLKCYMACTNPPPSRKWAGYIERDNFARGFFDHIPEPIVISGLAPRPEIAPPPEPTPLPQPAREQPAPDVASLAGRLLAKIANKIGYKEDTIDVN